MPKITFLGAGSTVFAKNVLGDCLATPSLADSDIALYDIDPQRLSDSQLMLDNLNRKAGGKARIRAYTREGRREALRGADFVVNAIQVGGYEPCTVNDFEIPKKYGLRQTIADTLGIGGIFRALRTIPVVLEFARDMEEVSPRALFLNYVNPMAMVTGALLRASGIRAVGLCHSVQVCAETLVKGVGMAWNPETLWKIAGINHQAWLLEISLRGEDLYPEIRRRSAAGQVPETDRVRHEIMRRFGYYVTESSEHSAEYVPWFIKAGYPELIERFAIPLDEYPRRCVSQIAGWQRMRDELVSDRSLRHERTHEYASYIMEAAVTNRPYAIGGNVLNDGIIANLPRQAAVEVPCLVDGGGVQPCVVGELPPQCAALNMTSVNVQLLTVEAALSGRRDHIYHAALLDPHTAAELPVDRIVALCDELIERHGRWLPEYR
ncbi:MAG: alpha-glucosidase/alpha-galactosidase [Spirochaetes bacterium RBG_13_68_11]|nr:MAG: alpha-glucosidase/alpha-galactosidase [Spirochaetes bacterium RBG_13_68_11]